MRTRSLPRPDRLVVSTRSRSLHAEFTSGTAPDRLAAVLLWSATLDGLSLAWTHRSGGVLALAATGRTASGLSLGLAASGPVVELAGRVLDLWPHRLAELAGVFALAEHHTEIVTYDEVAHVVTAARATASALEVAA
ncbi:hypothetical protein [Umezawaea beigongshangensis]|uniref:hypothetical protein n=1 Tax=Umezawaea beigongshangensis TaxID=2780383 RepID=UPI001E577616|nr:hypothetical protein [Umezawaea beigongshangensis]